MASPTKLRPLLDVGADRRKWRAWLRANHSKSKVVWLVYWRKASGHARLPYDAAVEEALCYGWIDSQQRGVDADRFAQRFTPRRPGSPLSEMNRQRVRRLVAQRKMRAAGLAALAGVFDPGEKEAPFTLAVDVERALRADADAWRNFQESPEAYRRLRVAYVEAGRRHGQREFRKRLRNLVRKSARGTRFGYVRPVG